MSGGRGTRKTADYPDTMTSMDNLASKYRDQGLWEVEKLGVQVMKTRKTKLGTGHPATLNDHGQLAVTDGVRGCCVEGGGGCCYSGGRGCYGTSIGSSGIVGPELLRGSLGLGGSVLIGGGGRA